MVVIWEKLVKAWMSHSYGTSNSSTSWTYWPFWPFSCFSFGTWLLDYAWPKCWTETTQIEPKDGITCWKRSLKYFSSWVWLGLRKWFLGLWRPSLKATTYSSLRNLCTVTWCFKSSIPVTVSSCFWSFSLTVNESQNWKRKWPRNLLKQLRIRALRFLLAQMSPTWGTYYHSIHLLNFWFCHVQLFFQIAIRQILRIAGNEQMKKNEHDK